MAPPRHRGRRDLLLVLLASRVEQAGNAVEAAELRQRAREAGEYMVLQPAIQEITQAGGTLADFEALLRGPAEAGDLFAMRTLAEQFDAAGLAPRPTSGSPTWGRKGIVCAPRPDGAPVRGASGVDGEKVWRWILEAGNSAALENLAHPRRDRSHSRRESPPLRDRAGGATALRGKDWCRQETLRNRGFADQT